MGKFLLGCLVLAGVVGLMEIMLSEIRPSFRLAISIPIGAGAYFLVLKLLKAKEIEQAFQMFAKKGRFN